MAPQSWRFWLFFVPTIHNSPPHHSPIGFGRNFQMGIEGIGARAARKEDKRFITGLGRYVDDMVVPGMKHAVFVRSPHAHADIVSVDVSAAKGKRGVIDVLTGKELKANGIGNLICGRMI